MKPAFRTRLLLFACLYLSSTCIHAQWQQTQGPEGGNTQDLILYHDTLWAGANGLYFSPDDGMHWYFHNAVNKDYTVLDLHVHHDALFAFVRAYELGWNSYENRVYRSQDGGQTWAMISQIPFSYSDDYRLATVRDYLFLIDNSQFYRSADDGLTWQMITLPQHVSEVRYDTATLLMRSYFDGLSISRDGADTWYQIADSAALFGTVHVVKDSLIIATNFQSDSLQYLITHDLGQTWTLFGTPPVPPMYSVNFYNAGGDTLFGWTDKLYWTTDFGAIWHLWSNNPTAGFPSILVPDGAYSVRNDGVWRYYHATGQWEKRNTGLFNSFVNRLFTNNQVLFAHTSVGLFGSVDAGAHWQEIPLPYSQSNSYHFDISGDTLFWAAYRTVYAYPYNTPGSWDTLANALGSGDPNYFQVEGEKIVWIRNANIYRIDRYTGAIDTIQPPAGTYNFNNALRIIGGRFIYSDNSGNAYISDDQGLTWTQTLSQSIPGNNSDNHLFYESGRLFVSTRKGLRISADNGSSWSDNIVYTPWSAAALAMTAKDNLLFLTLRGHGVLVSQDFGLSWQPYNTGLGSLNGRALTTLGEQIFAGADFNGVWRRTPNLNLLNGTVYADQNNNGTRDAGEPPFPGAIVRTRPGNLYAVSQADGAYALYAQPAADTLSVVPFSPYVNVQPAYRLANPGSSLDFGVYETPGVEDLDIALVNAKPFKPGFPVTLKLSCHNKGTVPQAPGLRLDLDPLVQYLDAYPWPDSFGTTQSVFWNLDTLAPYQTRQVTVTVLAQTAMIGDSLHLSAHVTPDANDPTPADNTAELYTAVVGAFDPNDKQADPADRITPAQVAAGEPVAYTIRFQNTGNHPATFIRIVDTLSPDFDIASLRVLSASHPFTWNLLGAGVLEFFFENIQLPDSASDPVASNGFVQYAIRAKPDLALNTPLRNRAFIYFDFNAPVETNTTSTVVAWLTAAYEAPAFVPLLISPNPASDQLMVTRASAGVAQLRVLDMNGREVWSEPVSEQRLRLAVGRLPQGYYSVFVAGNATLEWGRFVVQR